MQINFKHPVLPYLLVLGGAVLIFIWARSVKGFKGFKDGFEGFAAAAAAPDYHFRMYYADWCPHCVSAKPEFNKLGKSQTINGKVIQMQMVNAETEPEKVLEKVTGYPTIRLYDSKNALVDEYGGVRSFDGFMGYLETKLK